MKFNFKKYLLLIFTLCLLGGCYSAPTPIIIRDIPKVDLSDDMTIEDYMRSSTVWAVDITSYIKELINQIKHKVPYVDLRDEKNKSAKTK